MPIFWSSLVAAGLLVLVYLMIAGVPRVAGRQGAQGLPVPRTLLPVLGTFSTLAGVGGYLASREFNAGPVSAAFVAAIAGILGAVAAHWGVTSAFSAPSDDPEDDPRYRYQGHVATLTAAITSATPGRIEFEIDGTRCVFQARSFDGEPMPANTEVVIERIDDDLATVERWSVVEQRL